MKTNERNGNEKEMKRISMCGVDKKNNAKKRQNHQLYSVCVCVCGARLTIEEGSV